ncbi:hypothetical protein [Ferribacterium limneticum]|uniref:hypothetical protein n=1 Tax=Ferribacterium limneticum TaxID=76259 RepID=UPI001CFB9C54|nr:hypothetical protein [Ferribacterium limneticum]UCV17754.1 hypothetical protein KI610_13110 [Ferribacterium limneticum]
MIELFWEEFGLLRKMTGSVTANEWNMSDEATQAHERIDTLRYVIHDCSGVSDFIVPQDEIDFIAIRASVALRQNPRIKIAFVSSHSIVRKLIDTFNQMDRSLHRCCRFDTLEEARQFVGNPVRLT